MGELGTLYGMLLESVSTYLRRLYGEEMWVRIVEKSGVQFLEYATQLTIPSDDSGFDRWSLCRAPGWRSAEHTLSDARLWLLQAHLLLTVRPMRRKHSGPGAGSSRVEPERSGPQQRDRGFSRWSSDGDSVGPFWRNLHASHSKFEQRIITLIEQITPPGKKADLGDFLELWGCWFVDYCSTYGFDRIMRAAGRHYMYVYCFLTKMSICALRHDNCYHTINHYITLPPPGIF